MTLEQLRAAVRIPIGPGDYTVYLTNGRTVAGPFNAFNADGTITVGTEIIDPKMIVSMVRPATP